MKTARTPTELLAQLDEELAWRLQEISTVSKAIKTAKGGSEKALLRAAVPLLYAHWEGCIKSIAILYVEFISRQGHNYADIKHCFSGLRALGQTKQLHSISKRVFASSELLGELYDIPNQRAVIPLRSYVSNVGNLNFDMFEQVASFIDVDPSGYTARKNLIDQSLLKQRNEIAHGEFLMVDEASFSSMSREVLTLLRQFKDDVQNALVQKSYLR